MQMKMIISKCVCPLKQIQLLDVTELCMVSIWTVLATFMCITADKLCCVQALTLDSRSVEALSLKGLALMEVKKTPEALSHFREALRLAPHRFEAYNSTCLSLSLVCLGNRL